MSGIRHWGVRLRKTKLNPIVLSMIDLDSLFSGNGKDQKIWKASDINSPKTAFPLCILTSDFSFLSMLRVGGRSCLLCFNRSMFARKILVLYEAEGQRLPCPVKWMDSFSMRNFTNAKAFDDTLPVADGLMEIGGRVKISELQLAMEDWFHRKSYLPKTANLIVEEAPR